ncbi:MAG: ATP-binding protein [Deltaproteobacteria bacterium]|nr:ATP-binding protein [Deltaproteobacteria bacterium]
MKKTEIKKIIALWQDRFLQIEGITRDYEKDIFSSLGSKPIKIITGFRRAGKSFLTQQVARRAVNQQLVHSRNILYLNFEDFRLADINSPESLNDIYEVFNTEIAEKGKKLLIFDEIQTVRDWDKFIRTLYELEDESEIIITGSNSALLSSELGSNLAGRFIEFFILPFNFEEYLTYHGIELSDEFEFYRRRSEIKRYFNQYVQFGGLPETFAISTEDAKKSYLQGIISKVILDDIVKRFSIKRADVVEMILHYIALNNGNLTAFSRITNHLKNRGSDVTQDTVITYIGYIIKTFAIFEVKKFDWKLQRIFETTRKYFMVDTGLLNLYENTTANLSKQLENIVFLNLARKKQFPFFGELSHGKEIDFIAKETNSDFVKIQVTMTLDDENTKRELSSYSLADKYLKKGKNLLLSLDETEESLVYKHTIIERKNIIKWLLRLGVAS